MRHRTPHPFPYIKIFMKILRKLNPFKKKNTRNRPKASTPKPPTTPNVSLVSQPIFRKAIRTPQQDNLENLALSRSMRSDEIRPLIDYIETNFTELQVRSEGGIKTVNLGLHVLRRYKRRGSDCINREVSVAIGKLVERVDSFVRNIDRMDLEAAMTFSSGLKGKSPPNLTEGCDFYRSHCNPSHRSHVTQHLLAHLLADILYPESQDKSIPKEIITSIPGIFFLDLEAKKR
jgi:hypothetical protein